MAGYSGTPLPKKLGLKDGSRIAIVESGSGQATITLKTPNGVSLELTDQGGGKIEMKTAVSTVTIDSSGISVKTTNTKLQATALTVDAPKVDFHKFIAEKQLPAAEGFVEKPVDPEKLLETVARALKVTG